jgi:uncharacterized membrane protein
MLLAGWGVFNLVESIIDHQLLGIHHVPCPAIEGVEKEGSANIKKADDSVVDAVILSGAAETEHHEIAV